MVNFKLGERNVKVNKSACHERGTCWLIPFHISFTELKIYHLSFFHHTQYDIDTADSCSMQDAFQIWT